MSFSNPQPRLFTNSPPRTIVSVADAANGFQLSSYRDASVSYSVTIQTAVQIGSVAAVSGYVALEIASTNSSTAGNWIEISRASQSQSISLAVAFANTQQTASAINGIVPAGYYARLRSVNTAGAPTYTYNSGQEVLI